MFNTAITRLLWKEFRAQQAVWIAMAAELVLLQFWWGTIGHRSVDLNLLSVAFVLTGVFAMTSSALLFAGESEAKTDHFLRQMPFRRSELIQGKLLFATFAVAAFLVFSLVTTFIAGQMAGRYAGDSSSFLDDPGVFGSSIAGMWAWGLFYSLLTRRVVWTVVGAALTQILVGGLIHSGILNDLHLPDWSLYVVDQVVVLCVLAVDFWLLQRWCAGEAADSRPLSVLVPVSGSSSRVPDAPLPWLSLFRWSFVTGVTTGLYVMFLFFSVAKFGEMSVWDRRSILWVLGSSCVLSCITVFAISRARRALAGVDSARASSPMGLLDQPFTLRRCGSLLGLGGLSLLAYVLGFTACYASVATLAMMIAKLVFPGPSIFWSEIAGFLLTAIGSSFTLWFGDQWIKTGTLRGTGGWLSLLQRLLSVRSGSLRRISPLLWIEARRAFPIVLGGWVVLTLIGLYRPEMPGSAVFSYFGICCAALFCGLMTILPDRSQGTLAFLTERGVSPIRVLGTKALIWSGSLALMMIPPLVIQARISRLILSPNVTAIQQYESQIGLPFHEELHLTDWHSPTVATPAWHLVSLLGGAFLIGMLTASWIRRPVLAGLAGFMLTLLWLAWITILSQMLAPVSVPVLIPLLLLGAGILWTARPILLEQTHWRSKLGQISWMLLSIFVGLLGYFHFRANEIPDVSADPSFTMLRAGQPSPLGTQNSSWLYPFDASISHASQLDALVDDPLKRDSLVQPPRSLWGASHSFKTGIDELHLDDDSCDLDAAFEHLRKWHQLTELMAQNSRNEDGWVECLFARRVVLSAIRRWANHPQQTAERLEAALAKLPTQLYTTSGATVLAREYADTHRALETGVNAETIGTSNELRPSPIARWFLTRSSEKERVRRLIDFYFYLSAQASIQQAPAAGEAYQLWLRSTNSSAAALGVNLPWQVLNVRHRGQFEMANTAEVATRLVLQLQSWRLKHGSFPSSMIEFMDQMRSENSWIYSNDMISNEPFGYEPQGFDRDLRAAMKVTVPAKQPLIYSLGIDEPRGVTISLADNSPDGLSENRPYIYRARNEKARPWNPPYPMPTAADHPANPNAIRFVILGQDDDEDRLSDLPSAQTSPAENSGSGPGDMPDLNGVGPAESAGQAAPGQVPEVTPEKPSLPVVPDSVPPESP